MHEAGGNRHSEAGRNRHSEPSSEEITTLLEKLQKKETYLSQPELGQGQEKRKKKRFLVVKFYTRSFFRETLYLDS